jgi:archaellum component FlaF (FlaF/FlaG flagellin family)
MTITKKLIVDSIEVLENGSVQVRTKTAIMENGEQISGTFHRHMICPGDDYSAEDAKVQTICAAVHTQEIIAAYQEAQAAQIPA